MHLTILVPRTNQYKHISFSSLQHATACLPATNKQTEQNKLYSNLLLLESAIIISLLRRRLVNGLAFTTGIPLLETGIERRRKE
jgi:hypothetical protein